VTIRAARWYWALAFFALLLFGCATTKAVGTVAKQCEPSTDQEMAIIEALSTVDTAVALAKVDALTFGLCVLQRGVDEIIATLTAPPGTTTISATAADYSPVLANARAWRATHP
jgi:PBP1b-binding outer membrane lipoprotein LpoB